MSDAPNYLQHIQRVTNAPGTGEGFYVDLYGAGRGIDAFGRLRVSNPAGRFDSQHQYDTNHLYWYQSTPSGTVTHLPNESSVRLRITGPNQQVIRQTKDYFRYQPGNGQYVLNTFAAPTLAQGVTRKIGYLDGANGVFFKLSGQNASFVLRSSTSGSPVETEVSQASWNEDTFNGQGVSGVTLDFTKVQFFWADMEWQGAGAVRTGFIVDGVLYKAHTFRNTNVLSKVYMTTANLPVRYEISSDATAPLGNHDLIQICTAVISEGGQRALPGTPFSAMNASGTTAITTRQPILSIRPAATFNSIINRSKINADSALMASDAEIVLAELVYGGTLTNPSWQPVNSESAVEQDIAASAISGGIVTESFFVAATALGINGNPGSVERSILSKLALALDIDGNHPTTPYTDNLSLVVTSLGGSTNVAALLNGREIR